MTRASSVSTTSSADGDLAETSQANQILAGLKAKYLYLDGVTVSLGTTPHGEQAVAYYTEGRIVISRSHYVRLQNILDHEVWHIIDWRDNGRIDWHENVPPAGAKAYFRGTLPMRSPTTRGSSATTGPAV